jgi:ankyrin repeat protein
MEIADATSPLSQRQEALSVLEAVRAGDEELALALVMRGAGVDARGRRGETALLLAASNCSLELVQQLVAHGANVNAADKDGMSATMYAAESARLEVVQLLVESGANVNAGDKNSNTAVMSAAEAGALDVVRFLMDSGADVAAVEKDGTSVLMYAATSGILELVQFLVDGGADIHAVDKDGQPAIIFATWKGQEAVTRYLVSVGADVNVVDVRGWTPLIFAMEKAELDVVRCLVDAGADVNLADSDGSSPLMYAAMSESFDAMQFLVMNGADVNAVDSSEGNVFMYLAGHGDLRAMQLVVDAGADVTAADSNGRTALMYAAEGGKVETVRYILRIGGDVGAVASDGWTSLMYAVMSDNKDATLCLVEAGAEVNVAESGGWTPLMYAAMSGDLDIVRVLVEAGADVNAFERGGWTSLMYAAEENKLEVAQYLVEHGADVNMANEEGRTAVFLAAKQGHEAVQRLLIPHLRFATTATDITLLTSRQSTSWFISPFEIDLQSGGIGGDFRAKWLDADVVVKLFIPAASSTTFANEVAVWHQLRHPNVIKLFGACDVGHHFFVCEFASNGTVNEYLALCAQSGGHPTPWKFLLEAALGLAYLHERKIVHGDLRGGNILIGGDGLAKLANFSLSGSGRTGLLGDGVFGSDLWQSPERLSGDAATFASDVYSLGLCMVEMVTGRAPWADNTDGLVMFRKLSWDPASDDDSPFAPGSFSSGVNILLARMCALDPTSRATASAIIPMLERLAAEEESSNAFAQPDPEPLVGVEDYKDGELVLLMDKLRHFISQRDGDSLRQYAFDETQAIFEQLRVSSSSPKVLEHVYMLLIDFVAVTQPGFEQKRIYSLSSTRAKGDNMSTVQRRIDAMWGVLEGSRFDEEGHKLRWEEQRAKQLELYVSEVSQSLVLLNELDSEEDRATFMALLKSEIDAHTTDYTPGQLSVMQKAYVDLVQHTSSDALRTTPAWFLPWYELVVDDSKCLGEGGYGSVFRAKWLNSDVVVKRLIFSRTATKEEKAKMRQMFQREVDIWFGLSHPHVVRLFGACHVGTPFFVCEYEPNGTLLEFAEANPGQLWIKLYEAALGVLYLHERGVVHGDLKCNNIMVGRNRKAKVTDFGLSSTQTQADAAVTQVSGAWHWVAPECLAGSGAKATFESDVYSLGMCVVEALCNDCPWRSMPNAAVKFNVTRLKKLPPRPHNCTDEQWELVKKMCAHDPGKRMKMTTVVDELKALAGQNERAEREPDDLPKSLHLIHGEILAIKKHLQCDRSTEDSDNRRMVRQIYCLLWDRLDHLSSMSEKDFGDLERLQHFVHRARESSIALSERLDTLIQFTESALRGYALHRELDKLIAANVVRLEVMSCNWRSRCEEFLGIADGAEVHQNASENWQKGIA